VAGRAIVTASILDELSSLADRAGAYPTWAEVLFALTLALALISILVYAMLFPTAAPVPEPPQVPPEPRS
jgi:hypothetical protein